MTVFGNCSKCNRKNVKIIKGMCSGCYQKQRKIVCSCCNKYKVVGNKKLLLCKRCCKKLSTEICSVCKKNKPIDSRVKGKAICSNCRNKLKKKCSICGKINVVAINNDGIIVGKCCYKNKDKCSICGKTKSICTRDQNNQPICLDCRLKIKNKNKVCKLCGYHAHGRLTSNGLCYNCYCKDNKKMCEECGQIKADVFFNKKSKKMMCGYCVDKKYNKKMCVSCKRFSIPIKKVKNGYLCSSCYKDVCYICGKYDCVYKRTTDGFAMCRTCGFREKRENDLNADIRHRIRCRLYRVYKEYVNSGKVMTHKDIDYDAIIDYLGECPGDRSKYHIDHIFPLVAFDLTNEEDFKVACHPKNHQWLLAKDNLTKQAKYNQEELVFFKKEVLKQTKGVDKQ